MVFTLAWACFSRFSVHETKYIQRTNWNEVIYKFHVIETKTIQTNNLLRAINVHVQLSFQVSPYDTVGSHFHFSVYYNRFTKINFLPNWNQQLSFSSRVMHISPFPSFFLYSVSYLSFGPGNFILIRPCHTSLLFQVIDLLLFFRAFPWLYTQWVNYAGNNGEAKFIINLQSIL